MVQRTVLKVHISCRKCKRKLLKAVASLQGIDKIEVDEAKGTLTVTGNADPCEVIVRTRKAGKYTEVVSIGPPPGPPKKDEPKKPEEKKIPDEKPKPEAQFYHPQFCPICEPMELVVVERYDSMPCSIL